MKIYSFAKKSSKKILKLKKKITENEPYNYDENICKNNQTKKQVRFKEILDSIDKLSVIDENYEELDAYSDQDGLTKAETYPKSQNDWLSNSSIFNSFSSSKELRELKDIHNYNKDDQITISKYELVMVLKENEVLRKRNQAHKFIISEMKDKLMIVKQLVDDSEHQREVGLKHMHKLRSEAIELRKIFDKEKCFKENEENIKLIEELKIKLHEVNSEISQLK